MAERVSRTRRAMSGEIWRASAMIEASTRSGEGMDRWRSLFLREARVRVPSEKMSLEMGRRPCSKSSRRGWRRGEGAAEGSFSPEAVVSEAEVQESIRSSFISSSSTSLIPLREDVKR